MRRVSRLLATMVALVVMVCGLLISSPTTALADYTYRTSELTPNADLIISQDTTIIVDSDLTLKSISGDYNLTITGTGGYALTVDNPNPPSRAIEVRSCTIDATVHVYGTLYGMQLGSAEGAGAVALTVNGGTLTVDSMGTAIMVTNGTANFNGGTTVIDVAGEEVTGIKGACDVTIGSGATVSINATDINAKGIYLYRGDYAQGDVTVDGGTLNVTVATGAQNPMTEYEDIYPVYCKNGSFTVKNGGTVSAKNLDGSGALGYRSSGIRCYGDVLIVGSAEATGIESDQGSVTIAGTASIESRREGIRAYRDIALGGTFDVTSTNGSALDSEMGDITLTGDFTLWGEGYGIMAHKGSIITKGNVVATGEYNMGVRADAAVVVLDGRLEATGGGRTHSIFSRVTDFSSPSLVRIDDPVGGSFGDQTVLDADGHKAMHAVLIARGSASVRIDGEAPYYEGQTLHGTKYGDPTFPAASVYRWQRSTDNETWTDIPGATSLSYPVKAGEGGAYFRIAVTCNSWYGEYRSDPVYVESVSLHTVTFDLNGRGWGCPAAQTVADGGKATQPSTNPTAGSGFAFGGWYTTSDCTAAYDFSTPVTSDITLYAKWSANPRQVSFDANGGTGTMQSVSVGYYDSYTLPECGFTPPAGKAFDRWNGGSSYGYKHPGTSVTILQDATFAAEWRNALVYFNANGGTGTMGNISTGGDTSITLPWCSFTPPPGMTFNGWRIGDTTYYPGQTYTPYGDVQVVAQWKKCGLHFSANGGSGSMTMAVADSNGNVVLPTCTFTPPEGKQFAYWYVSAATQSVKIFHPGETVNIVSDATARAIWIDAIPQYMTLSFDANGGSGTMESFQVDNGTTIEAPECSFDPPEGYRFQYWNVLSNGVSVQYCPAGEELLVQRDYTLQAIWRLAPDRTVTFIPTRNASYTGTAPDPQIVDDGGYAYDPGEPEPWEGMRFIGWSTSQSSSGELFDFASTPITDNITLYGQWETQYYNVSVVSGENGTASASAEQMTGGGSSSFFVSVTPDEGYEMDEFFAYNSLGGEVEVNRTQRRVYMPYDDVTVVVTFKPKAYDVLVWGDPEGNGTVSATPTSGVAGTGITVTATPNPGYMLETLTWRPTSGGVEARVDITDTMDALGNATFTMPQSDVIVEASFVELPEGTYSVTVRATAGGTATSYPSSAATGTRVTLSATPSDNYAFKAWHVVSGDVELDGNGFVMGTDNVVIEAEFEWSAVVEAVPMFRLYNRWTYEHFYCSDPAERDKLVSVGWTDEGIGWYAPSTGDPVYRLYNQWAPGGDHHYTMDLEEYEYLVSVGWTGEGVGWYSDPNQAVPVYREYNPYEQAHNHNYTPDKAEHDNLVSLGWKDEGIGWYGV